MLDLHRKIFVSFQGNINMVYFHGKILASSQGNTLHWTSTRRFFPPHEATRIWWISIGISLSPLKVIQIGYIIQIPRPRDLESPQTSFNLKSRLSYLSPLDSSKCIVCGTSNLLIRVSNQGLT